MARRDPELREPAAGERDLGVELRVTLLATLGARREQPELLELARKPRVDARALAKPGQVELRLVLAQACTPALAVTCGRRGKLLADDPERQKLVSLEPQDRLEPLEVVLAEEPVAALRPARSEQPLVLEVADLRDRDVREVVLEQLADGPDRQHPGLREPSPSAVQERESVLADLQLVAVFELSGLDTLAVHEGAVEAAQVLDEERAVPLGDDGVLARDGDVVEEDPAVGRAADRRLAFGDEGLPRPAAAGADDERRPPDAEILERSAGASPRPPQA